MIKSKKIGRIVAILDGREPLPGFARICRTDLRPIAIRKVYEEIEGKLK